MRKHALLLACLIKAWNFVISYQKEINIRRIYLTCRIVLLLYAKAKDVISRDQYNATFRLHNIL